LAQQNGFGPAFFHCLLRLVNGTANPKSRYVAYPSVDWLDTLIGPGGYLLVVSKLFAVPVLVLWGKKPITKLKCEKCVGKALGLRPLLELKKQ
jgi:hypothetical protein